MVINILILVLGIVCAGLGGEVFLRGLVGLAHWARISASIIGVTIAAFATSSPELTVAVTASLAGTPQLPLGNALGSNILNVSLILGVALLLGNLYTSRQAIRRDYTLALLAPAIIGVLAVDGTLSRLDGILLLAVFLAWLILVTREASRQRSAADEVLGEPRLWRAVGFSILGLPLLILSGLLIVHGANAVARAWGLDAFIVGALIVSVGTTVPEMATTLIARLKKHDEIGLGTVLGSNIFNALCIVGVAAVLHPIPIVRHELVVALAFGAVVVALTLPTRAGVIQRWRGVLLLALYLVYVMALVR